MMPDAKPIDVKTAAAVVMNPPRTFRRIPLAPHQLLAPITPQNDLFVLAHVGVPHLRAEEWSLAVTGLVERETTFSFEQLRHMPKREVQAFHQCAGYPQNPRIATRRVGNVVWGGVDLRILLEQIGVQPQARFLWSYGCDGGEYDGIVSERYLKDCPLERLARGDVLLAYEINGEPLTAEHGFPLRLVIPGFYGTNSVKWLCRLHLADSRAKGPFTTELYNDRTENGMRPVWEVAPESLIVSPGPDAHLPNAPMEIWGWAWADGGVARVEISTDGGQAWRAAVLEARTGASWQRFKAMWEPEGTGEAILMSRATANDGTVQPPANWRNSIYAVRVMKTGMV
ncbi:MAG TPA: molybdopterin-dependent oxidoreductase [Rhizomicrobium sp.]|jgi:DMSO/TMAO reductase YedYZ molybdopterin-dependent catalytic subunit|nr:molybdopterin-dependent oxidoreductase [Rhizomicrobium sp.]